jgi:predicted ATPase
VGEWYEANYASDLMPHYPLLAHHWTRTVQSPPFEPDALQKAIDYSFKAGEQALRNDALLESLGHFTKALELIKTLPESPQRDGMELSAQVLRAVPLTLTRGWAHPEVGIAYERAHELTKRLGESPQMFLALVGVFTYYLVRGNFRQASEMGDVNYAVAQKSEDPELILEASQDRGAAHFYMGQLEESLPYLARVSELYIPEKHHYHAFAYGRDPLAVALQHESLAYWYLGFPDKALERSDTGMRLTEQWHHPFSRAWVLISRCLTLLLRGDLEEMQATAQEGIGLAAAQGFPNWLAQGLVYLGWTIAAQGDVEQGIAKIREGLGIWRMTGAVLATPIFLYLLADAHARAGQMEEARSLVEEALSLIDQTEERVWEPEIHRLRGELYLQESPAVAEAHFKRALSQAREQKARSDELRSAISLAALWKSQGKAKEAGDLLQPIYADFTEGFNTRDLKQAKELLEDLTKE